MLRIFYTFTFCKKRPYLIRLYLFSRYTSPYLYILCLRAKSQKEYLSKNSITYDIVCQRNSLKNPLFQLSRALRKIPCKAHTLQQLSICQIHSGSCKDDRIIWIIMVTYFSQQYLCIFFLWVWNLLKMRNISYFNVSVICFNN